MCTGFHLQPRGSPAARAVSRRGTLAHDTLVSPGQRGLEERPRLLALRGIRGVVHSDAPYPHGPGNQPGQFLVASGEGEVEELPSVDGERVEENGDHGDGACRGDHVPPGPHPARGLLERPGPPVVPERDDLPVQDEPAGSEAGHRRDELGKAVGDVLEGAGVDAHLVPVAVHLHPDAVELLLDGTGAQAVDGLDDGAGGVGQHGLDRPADGEPEGRECRRTFREDRPGDRPEAPGEHDGAADLGGRCSGGHRQKRLA